MTAQKEVLDNPLRTRADARRLLLELFKPLAGHFSSGRAQVRVGPEAAHFDRKAEWFEGFARPLWGLAPLQAGGGAFDQWDLFVQGIVSGTDPSHPEYWEPVGNNDQRSVEMAALGFALAIAPEKLWDALPQTARANLATWLGGIQGVVTSDNNWHFFPVLAGLGLQRCGIAIDQASRDAHLARIDEFYLSDGWYGDGPGGYIDHYNGFALQFYGLIYARHMERADPERARIYRDRATQFAQGFRHWFAADGAGLAMGRSLTYRFAKAAFWGALAYAGVEALPWGEIRGLWARQLRWWLHQPILTGEGLLPIGYSTPNVLMSEEYNSQGSPYWAFKAFLPLALPDEHPFWSTEEAPHPVQDGVVTLRGASMIANRHRGEVVVLPGAPGRVDMRGATDKYAKLAYSTHHSLAVESDRWLPNGFCGDNILALSTDGSLWSARRSIAATRLGDDWIETQWSPLPGVTVTTLQGFSGAWELRAHRVCSDVPLLAIESGHALPYHTQSRRGLVQAITDGAERPPGVELALSDGLSSAAVCLAGRRGARSAAVAPNTHLMFPKASVPVLLGRIPETGTVLFTAVAAGRSLGLPAEGAMARLLAAAGWPETPPCTVPDIRTELRERDN
jgi:hypothetical protein